MWNRQELKSNARIMLKANYLKIVIVSVVFALLTSSGYQSKLYPAEWTLIV